MQNEHDESMPQLDQETLDWLLRRERERLKELIAEHVVDILSGLESLVKLHKSQNSCI